MSYLKFVEIMGSEGAAREKVVVSMSATECAGAIVRLLQAGNIDLINAISAKRALPMAEILAAVSELPADNKFSPQACIWLARLGCRQESVRDTAIYHLIQRPQNLLEIQEIIGGDKLPTTWLHSKLEKVIQAGPFIGVDAVRNLLTFGACPREGAKLGARFGHEDIVLTCMAQIAQPTRADVRAIRDAWSKPIMPKTLDAALLAMEGATQLRGTFVAPADATLAAAP